MAFYRIVNGKVQYYEPSLDDFGITEQEAEAFVSQAGLDRRKAWLERWDIAQQIGLTLEEFCELTPLEFERLIRLHDVGRLQPAAPAPDPKAERALKRQAFLKRIQEETGKSKSDIHKASGPDYKTLRRWETGYSGSRTPEVRGRIAKALSLDISEIPE